MLYGDFWGTLAQNLLRLWNWDHIWVDMTFREQKKRTGWANTVSYEHNGWKFKAVQKWLGETPELFQALHSKCSAPFVQSVMIRTEIYHLSSEVLVDANKIQLTFQAARNHSVLVRMALREGPLNGNLTASVSLGFVFPQTWILCHPLLFRCWMALSNGLCSMQGVVCPSMAFLSSQKFPESSWDIAGPRTHQCFYKNTYDWHYALNWKKRSCNILQIFVVMIWNCSLRNADKAD